MEEQTGMHIQGIIKGKYIELAHKTGDPTIPDIFAEINEQRHQSRPRGINLSS